jgi:hypothetical protein
MDREDVGLGFYLWTFLGSGVASLGIDGAGGEDQEEDREKPKANGGPKVPGTWQGPALRGLTPCPPLPDGRGGTIHSRHA